MINLAINWPLLSNFTYEVLNAGGLTALPENYQPIIKLMFMGTDHAHWAIRPLSALSSLTNLFPANPLNPWELIADLHINSFVFGLMVLIFCKCVGATEEIMQAIPYYDPKEIKFYHRWLLGIFGYSSHLNSSQALYEKERITMRFFGWEPVRWFREAIFHPWSILTRINKRREIVMVDVLVTEGSIYSGFLTTWVHSENSVTEIAMEYALRYYPKTPSPAGKALADKKRNDAQKINPTSGSSRRVEFVKNNGELILPREKIETVHFWEIRRGSKIAISIKGKADLEKLKWYLVIAYVFLGFIKEISILVGVSASEWNALNHDLGSWLETNKIKFQRDQIKIQVVSRQSPPEKT